MKKIVLTIKIAIVLLVTTTSFSQIINFPDANFKAVLLSANENNPIAGNNLGEPITIDANNNGEVEVSEALNVYSLEVFNAPVFNLSSIEYFINLEYLNVIETSVTSLNVSFFPNLIQLNCRNNLISTITFGSNTVLTYMICNNNQISNINLSGCINLEYFELNDNLLQSLNVNQLQNLQVFTCENNLLTSLDVSNMNALEYFNCKNNSIQNINLNNSVNIVDLDCSNNQLSNLNLNGLINLVGLSCNFNNLQTLSVPNSSVFQYLRCSNNLLTNLSINCPNLYTLFCSNNQLSSIDLNAFTGLNWFNGSNNLLTNINIDGLNDLADFQCNNNLLTNVEFTSNTSTGCVFNFDNNQLTSLLLKNGVYQSVSFNNNPNLTYICGDFFELSDLQYYVNQNGLVNCSVSSYCEPTLPYPLSLQGVFKYDNSVNGCDANDPIINDVKLRIDRSSIIQPFYTFNSEPLEAYYPYYYTLTPTFENKGYFNVTPPQASFNFYETGINSFAPDFCVAPNGTHNDLEVVLLPISDAIPGSDVNYKLVYKNKGTHTQSGNLSLNLPSNLTTFISSSINPSSQSINQILWGFTDLLPFETREIPLTLNLDAAVGTIMNFSTSISSSNADQTPADNIFQLNQTAAASPTANTISCLQGATIQTSQVGNYVHYLVRFKNNSLQDANSISITTDMLNIDHNTIIPISASHQYTASIKEMLTNNIFEVKFQFIALQVNEEGYIAFKIKTFPNLVTGNNFKNTAKIFFNNNAPIVTNTATTYVGNVLSTDNFEKNDAPVFYPNPAQNNITFNQDIKTVSVYTLDGKLLNTQLINNQVDLSGFNQGIYLVRGTTNDGVTFSEKLVKN